MTINSTVGIPVDQMGHRAHQVFFERIILRIGVGHFSAIGTTCFQIASPFSLMVANTVGVMRMG